MVDEQATVREWREGTQHATRLVDRLSAITTLHRLPNGLRVSLPAGMPLTPALKEEICLLAERVSNLTGQCVHTARLVPDVNAQDRTLYEVRFCFNRRQGDAQ